MKGLKLIEIEKILKFDPYMNLGEEYLQKLYKDDAQDQLISEVFLWEFSRCYTEPEMTGWFEEILLSEEIRRRYDNCTMVLSPCLVCAKHYAIFIMYFTY